MRALSNASGEELAFLPRLWSKSTHLLSQVPEEGGAWLLPRSSSRAKCLLVPPGSLALPGAPPPPRSSQQVLIRK